MVVVGKLLSGCEIKDLLFTILYICMLYEVIVDDIL